jgi:flagellar biogenesis protein FliO
MELLGFLGGNGLFLILALVLIIVYFVNRNRRR